MSVGYRLSPAAQRDLGDIWTYTLGVWGIDQARRYIRSIRDACEALGHGRKRGQPVDDIRPGYLRLPVGAHVLFYRLGDAGVRLSAPSPAHGCPWPIGELMVRSSAAEAQEHGGGNEPAAQVAPLINRWRAVPGAARTTRRTGSWAEPL